MAKLKYSDTIKYFWNRDDFSVAAFARHARIYANRVGESPYYIYLENNCDEVVVIKMYTIKMSHMKNADGGYYTKTFTFNIDDIVNVEHLIEVCENTFNQLVIEELRYLNMQLVKMKKFV